MNKMTNIQDIYTSVISCLGLSLGTTNIYETLNIVLVVLSIINILIMGAFRVYTIIKEKGITKDSIEDVQEVIEDIKEDINDVKRD